MRLAQRLRQAMARRARVEVAVAAVEPQDGEIVIPDHTPENGRPN